jgi:hypothetical protein
MSKKLPKITYTFTQSWPKNDWASNWHDQIHDKDFFIRMINNATTDLTLTSQDLQEFEVEKSANKEAVVMLEAIGIKCE